jgi:superfamily II DNA or RNA helicase
MLSAVARDRIACSGAKAAVLAHRDELTDQNRGKFRRVAPGVSTSVVDAAEKSWAGQVTFAMVPTLARAANLDAMPALDLLVIDEAHHVVADSYRRVIDHALQRNPMCRVFGVTATPNRGDRKGLRKVFSNVADQIRLGELIASGHLVKPRTFIIDVGVQDDLRNVPRAGEDYDMAAVAQVMDTVPVTDAVLKHWHEHAGDRQTVVFCSTVAMPNTSPPPSIGRGVPTVMVTGDMPDGERPQRAGCLCCRRGAGGGQCRRAHRGLGIIRRPPASCCCGRARSSRP